MDVYDGRDVSPLFPGFEKNLNLPLSYPASTLLMFPMLGVRPLLIAVVLAYVRQVLEIGPALRALWLIATCEWTEEKIDVQM